MSAGISQVGGKEPQIGRKPLKSEEQRRKEKRRNDKQNSSRECFSARFERLENTKSY